MTSAPEVLANGGVIVKKGELDEADYYCALVHRPKYDDWSLPKGKQDEGEDPLDCALREVREETGYECSPVREILSSSYLDDHGRSKLVRYWLMIIEQGAFAPNEEVDSMVWIPFHLAKNTLTYDWDREVLSSAESILGELDLG